MRLFKFGGNKALDISRLSAEELIVLYKFVSQEVAYRLNNKSSAVHDIIDFSDRNPLVESILLVDKTYDNVVDQIYGPAKELTLLEGAIEKSLEQVIEETAPEPKAKKKATKKV